MLRICVMLNSLAIIILGIALIVHAYLGVPKREDGFRRKFSD